MEDGGGIGGRWQTDFSCYFAAGDSAFYYYFLPISSTVALRRASRLASVAPKAYQTINIVGKRNPKKKRWRLRCPCNFVVSHPPPFVRVCVSPSKRVCVRAIAHTNARPVHLSWRQDGDGDRDGGGESHRFRPLTVFVPEEEIHLVRLHCTARCGGGVRHLFSTSSRSSSSCGPALPLVVVAAA